MTTHRERLLGQARADLVALPDLTDELARLLTERPDATTRPGKPGSRAPLRLDVLHLVDLRRKPGWDGEDPREKRWILAWTEGGGKKHTHSQLFTTQDGAWNAWDTLSPRAQDTANIRPFKAVDHLGIAPLLETWVRILWEEIPELLDLTETATVRSEAAVLVEHWSWIEGERWAEELAGDILRVITEVKAALGIPKEQRYLCPECQNPAYLVPGGILSCQEGHERVVRDLERQQRRRPAISTKDTCAEFGLTETQLWQWKHRRKITPTKDDRGRLWWWPWDVFCLLNPDIAEAIRLRDEMAEDDQKEAERAVP